MLLIDTYDTERAAHKVVELSAKLRADGITIKGVRIDSGDLGAHARQVRASSMRPICAASRSSPAATSTSIGCATSLPSKRRSTGSGSARG